MFHSDYPRGDDFDEHFYQTCQSRIRDMNSDKHEIAQHVIKFDLNPMVRDRDSIGRLHATRKFDYFTVDVDDEDIESDLVQLLIEYGLKVVKLDLINCSQLVWQAICEHCVNLETVRVNFKLIRQKCTKLLTNLREVEFINTCCDYVRTHEIIDNFDAILTNQQLQKIIINGVEEPPCGCCRCFACYDSHAYVDIDLLKKLCNYARLHNNREIVAVIGVQKWAIDFDVPENMKLLINFECCGH